MAKNTAILRQNSVLVHASSVIWLKEYNAARQSGDYGNLDDLFDSFVERDWVPSGDGTIEVEELPEKYVEKAKTIRQEQWESLKAAVKTDESQRTALATFEEIYTEKGKLRPVDYIGVTGNRRGEVYFRAMVERKKLNRPIKAEIPVQIREFKNELDRLSSQIGENEGKSLGFLEMSDSDKLRAAKQAVDFGAIQSDLRKTFKDGTGQKLWATLLLNKRFPNLKLYERMCLPPEDKDHIRFGGQSTTDLNDYITRTDPKALAEKNRNLKNPLKEATADDVLEFFTKKREGNLDKIMARKNIKELSTDFAALPLRAAFKAVIENNTDFLKPYHTASVGLNALDAIIADGDYPPMELFLVKIMAIPSKDRKPVMEDVMKHLFEIQNPNSKPAEPKTEGHESRRRETAGTR